MYLNISTLLVLFSICLSQPALAESKKTEQPEDYTRGLASYDKGDHATALLLWFPLAEKGHADSQYMLGTMYLEQKSPSKDPAEAANWLQRAAEQNHAKAQSMLKSSDAVKVQQRTVEIQQQIDAEIDKLKQEMEALEKEQ